jgi:IS605 OrfB family transposase
MQVQVSIPIKIRINESIVNTFTIYKKALQFCIDTGWKMKIKNNIQLHPFVYTQIRNFGLPSQLTVACIKQACGMLKKAKTKPFINKTSIRYNTPRSFSFKNNILSIGTINGRVKIPIKIPEYSLKYFNNFEIRESLLIQSFKGDYYFTFTFLKETPNNLDLQRRVLGVDLGINNLAVTSDKQFFKLPQVKKIKRKFKFLRTKLQAKGTRSSKRLLRKLSGKEKRFMAYTNHCISKQIVDNFDGCKIIMENLKGIRKRNRGRTMNYWISNWSFFQLQSFIEYKAIMKGIEVIRVSPFKTSQICSHCGCLGSRSKGFFSCVHCGYSLSADLNASLNLASPILEQRQAVFVNQPHVSSHDTEALL